MRGSARAASPRTCNPSVSGARLDAASRGEAVQARVRGLRPRAGRGGLPVSYTHLTLPTICSV
eukprot:13077606-Alexandrium_andersonii.AAC.1